MHYREEQIHRRGAAAAQDGYGPETNPHKPKTNFHRYWAAGHASAEQSKTLANHTYTVGDKVRWRYGRQNTVPFMIVAEIFDVPEDQILFDPNIPEEDNFTGVGHHQWLSLREGEDLRTISGLLVELYIS